MRLTTGLILLAALAGCGSGQKAGNAATAGPAANTSAAPVAAPASAPAPAAPAAGEARGLAEFREDASRGCIEGGRETAPPGTPVERHCACAVERVMTGRTLAELEADERSGAYERRFRDEIRACTGETGG